MLHTETLPSIKNSTPTSEIIFKTLSERERDRETLDLRRFKLSLEKAGHKVNLSDYKKTFLFLDKAGYGKITYSKMGNLKYFTWNYSLKSVGQKALEQGELMPRTRRNKFEPVPGHKASSKQPAVSQKATPDEMKVVVRLKDGSSIELFTHSVQATAALVAELTKGGTRV